LSISVTELEFRCELPPAPNSGPPARWFAQNSAMDANELNLQPPRNPYEPPVTLVEAIPEFAIDYPPPGPVRRIWLPVLLFIATCVSTLVAGVGTSDNFPGLGGRRLSTSRGLAAAGDLPTE